MNKADLKQLIKPLVKECINEVLIEEGLLSNVVSEVVRGMQSKVIVEQKTNKQDKMFNESLQIKQKSSEVRQKLQQHREQLMHAIGEDAYNGVDLFEGTKPMTNHETSEPSPGSVDLGSAADSGVDISSLVGGASRMWNAMK